MGGGASAIVSGFFTNIKYKIKNRVHVSEFLLLRIQISNKKKIGGWGWSVGDGWGFSGLGLVDGGARVSECLLL